MNIDRRHVIDVDAYQFILKKRGKKITSGKNKGEYSYSTIGYYKSLLATLRKYLELDIKHMVSTSDDMEELIGKLGSLDKKIEDLSKSIDPEEWNKLKRRIK